jgi:Rps23 Pro-64 3,4-dihydroxylase Tpa1-like proline 4-hydroxylase
MPLSETANPVPLGQLARCPRSTRLNYRAIEGSIDKLAAQFAKAEPFPHIVIDHLVSLSGEDLTAFPDAGWEGWASSAERYQQGKTTCSDSAVIPAPLLDIIDELSRPRFLRALEQLTAIEKLIPDPYLIGAGLHLTGPGGTLTPHTDFHYHAPLNLYRRINILLYLNETWSESDGGCLELTDRSGGQRVVIAPEMGRCVIFATSDRSVHGVPKPVAPNRFRESIALYFYTAQDSDEFGGLFTTTDWQEHGAHRGVNRARLAAYKGLLQGARALTLVAHLANPNQGPAVVRSIVREHRAQKSKTSVTRDESNEERGATRT